MKLENKSCRTYMYGMNFLNPNEVAEVPEKDAKILLKQEGVSEVIDKAEVDALKKELELAKAKEKATALGIKYSPNIGLDKLLKKIEEAEK